MAAALPQAQVSSAGLGAMIGYQADPMARQLMSERGFSIDGHRARQINLDMCQRVDLILVMDREQRREVEHLYPFTSGKVFRLCEASGQDVPDPYRASRGAFEQSFALINSGAQQWIDRIFRVASR